MRTIGSFEELVALPYGSVVGFDMWFRHPQHFAEGILGCAAKTCEDAPERHVIWYAGVDADGYRHFQARLRIGRNPGFECLISEGEFDRFRVFTLDAEESRALFPAADAIAA